MYGFAQVATDQTDIEKLASSTVKRLKDPF